MTAFFCSSVNRRNPSLSITAMLIPSPVPIFLTIAALTALKATFFASSCSAFDAAASATIFAASAAAAASAVAASDASASALLIISIILSIPLFEYFFCVSSSQLTTTELLLVRGHPQARRISRTRRVQRALTPSEDVRET